MQEVFIWFGCLLAILFGIQYGQSSGKESQATVVTSEFKHFQWNYLLIYLIVMGADWLQGPYVYALYRHYEFDIAQIGSLFVAGFGSSALFGVMAGTLADKYGRKKMCLLFTVLYSVSCLTKHSPDYNVLWWGRVFAGFATSILFSAFESWMVHQHHEKHYAEEWLGITYSVCTGGNAIVAILSGIVASFAFKTLGPVGPFDVSLSFLLIALVLIACSWKENYGDSSIDLKTTLVNAAERVRQDVKITLLGCVQALFEGAMYIFVFMWTPALEVGAGGHIDHGWVFACFMICVWIGSELFRYALSQKYSVERLVLYVFVVAAVALGVPIVTQHIRMRAIAFFVFEVCVGIFWPSLAFLRSRYVPEEVRTTVINLFRTPLNLLVILVLSNIGSLAEHQVFSACLALLIPAVLCQIKLVENTVESPEVGKKFENGEIPLVVNNEPNTAAPPS